MMDLQQIEFTELSVIDPAFVNEDHNKILGLLSAFMLQPEISKRFKFRLSSCKLNGVNTACVGLADHDDHTFTPMFAFVNGEMRIQTPTGEDFLRRDCTDDDGEGESQ